VVKALGTRARTLVGGLVTQAAAVAIVASLVGSAIAVVFDRVVPPGSIPYQLLPGRLVGSSVALVAAAIVGSVFSLRRVLRVDPATAIGRSS
jgi:putative ABC transport system permease protein